MSGNLEIDALEGPNSFDLASDESHKFVLNRYQGMILELEDTHFSTNSAVLLPLPQANTDIEWQYTAFGVLYAGLKHAAENSSQKLIITGHTDSSGRSAENLSLSQERADGVLAMLTNDKDSWVRIADSRHQVSDYQLILYWVSSRLRVRCDPGPVDNQPGSRTRQGLRSFQLAYNQAMDADITVDGLIGEETWGAIFHVMQWRMGQLIEQSGDDLEQLRGALNWVDTSKQAVGCGEHFPVDGSYVDDYRSGEDRRVELLFFEPAYLPPLNCHARLGSCNPDKCAIHSARVYSWAFVDVEILAEDIWLDLQTVDDFGITLPDITLRLTPQVGDEILVTTDGQGYASTEINCSGLITITLENGSAVRLGSSQNDTNWRNSSGDLVATAIINPRNAVSSVTDIVVPTLSDDEVALRARIEERYGRPPGVTLDGSAVPTSHSMTVRGGATQDTWGEAAQDISARGGEQAEPAVSARRAGAPICDNLCLAAGFSGQQVDRERLVELVKEWTSDRYPTIRARGFIMQMILGNQIMVVDESGNDLGHYQTKEGVRFLAAVGAYTLQETNALGDPQSVFIDMTRGRDMVGIEDPETDSAQPRGMSELLIGDQGSNYEQRVTSLVVAEQKILITYVLPSGGQSVGLARRGGTGMLEHYSGSGSIRDHIHDRNVAVVEATINAYRNYLNAYIRQIETAADEIALHALGPPGDVFQFPMPAGIDGSQRRDIWDLYSHGPHPLDAYKALTKRLDQIFGRRSEGSCWIKFEFVLTTGQSLGRYVDAEIKYNFTVDDEGRFQSGNVERNATVRLTPAGTDGAGGSVTIDADTGETKTKGTFNIGGYGFEISDDGQVKATAGPGFAEVNAAEAQMGGGVEFSTKDLIKKRYESRGVPVPDWVNQMPEAKLAVGLYFQSLRYGTILAVVSRAPGFFSRRPITQLMTLDWESLDAGEHGHLETLEWNKSLWDFRVRRAITDYPESARTPFNDLPAAQAVAAVHLGLPSGHSEWVTFWRNQAATVRIEREPLPLWNDSGERPGTSLEI